MNLNIKLNVRSLYFLKEKSCYNDNFFQKDIFGVVNKGCDSKQVTDFIKRTTGHEIKLGDEKE